MNITVKLQNEPIRTIKIKEQTTIEELLTQIETKYPIYAATINDQFVSLNTMIKESSNINLYDIRNNYANQCYQHTLAILYLEAIHQILPEGTNVKIANSLSKGIYTTIQTNVTDELVSEIEQKMKQLVSKKLQIHESKITRQEVLSILKKEKDQKDHKYRLYQNNQIQEIYQNQLLETKEFSYLHLLPNTRYLTHFSLKRYRKGVLMRFPHPSNPNIIPPFEEQTLLYDAFAREDKWEKLLGISYAADLNNASIHKDEEMIMVTEALHEKRISELAETIYNQKKRLILIAGPSSSGKTSFAKRLIIQLRVCGLNPLYLGTDDYFVNRADMTPDKNGEIDFEALSAVDVPLLTKQMNELLEGKTVDIPRFDFVKGEKVFGERIVKIEENQPIVLEGIHGLNPKLTEGILEGEKYRIYISPLTSLNIDLHHRIPTTDIRLIRRMVRDGRVRNKNTSATIQDWPSVRKGEDQWIFPYSNIADTFFNSSLVYELAVLKKYAKPLLQEIQPQDPAYQEAQRLLTFLQYFEEMDDTKIVSNSILREFIGGSLLAN